MKIFLRSTIWFIIVLIYLLWFYIKEVFGGITAEQILFYAQYGQNSLDSSMDGITILFVTTFFVAFLIVLVAVMLFKIIHHCFEHKYSFQKLNKLLSYSPLLAFMALLYMIYSEAKIGQLLQSHHDDFIGQNYIKPSNINIKKKNAKNLVFIYVESLETIYRNKDLFGSNLIKSLDDLPGYEFKNFVQVPNTGWTIAAIVASQCGVPLKPMFYKGKGGNMIGEVPKNFLPSAVCLGDILSSYGYHNEYIQGADLSFAGKEKFLKEHGYTKASGFNEWLAMGYQQREMNAWGLYDDSLMKEARGVLDKLVKSKKLFNLTILTLDTHFPDGHLSKTCEKSGGKDFKDIIKCSSNEVVKFVNYIIDKGYLEHTNIVIIGDHLTMPNPLFKLIEQQPNRRIFNKWISKDAFIKNRDQITHFDVAPTILDFIGLNLIESRFALGYSALGKERKKYPRDIIKAYFAKLNDRSQFYNSLWQVQKTGTKH